MPYIMHLTHGTFSAKWQILVLTLGVLGLHVILWGEAGLIIDKCDSEQATIGCQLEYSTQY